MTMDPNQHQPAPPPPPPPQQQASYGHPHGAPFQHLLQQQQHQQLQMFWNYQRQEIEHSTDFKNHQLPLARIKKIMKADEDVRMISAEAPVLFAKACELFILELTIRSWLHAEENKRRTLQKNDIAAAINRTDIFDFLVDIVPRDDGKEEEGVAAAAAAASSAAAVVAGTAAAAAAAAAGVPYYYPAMGQPAVVPGLDPAAAAAYGQPAWQGMWGPQPPSQHLHGGGGEEGGGSYGGAPRMDGSGYVRNPNQEGS